MSFSSLKKSSTSSISNLTKELDKMNKTGGGRGPDERLWKPEVDKAGNGYAVIRFLPAPAKEELPWAQVWSHAFQGPGGWFIENCLTTVGGQCPVCEKQKRKLSYYSNIYVVKDPLHPENEGKVFLYKYGKKIHDKIVEALKPQFEDEQPIDPFCFWKGADFKLKIVKQDGYWNYDRSEFSAPGTLGDFDDEQLEAIYNQEYSLSDFTDPKNFKSYEELEARLNLVLGRTSRAAVVQEEEQELDTPVSFNEPSTPEPSGFGSAVSSMKEEEDPDLSYFAKLAEE